MEVFFIGTIASTIYLKKERWSMNVTPRDKKRVDVIFFIFIFLIVAGILFAIIWHNKNNPDVIKEHELKCKENLTQSELVLADAVRNNDTRKIRSILKKDESIIENSFSDIRYYSILHYAVEIQKYKSAEQLLKSGYNPDVRDSHGKTPLYIATDPLTLYLTIKKYPDDIACFVNLLLDFKASPDIPDDKSTTPLINAPCAWNDFPIQRALVEKGKCNIDLVDASNHSAAYYSLKYGNIYLAHYLIVEHNADTTRDASINLLASELE